MTRTAIRDADFIRSRVQLDDNGCWIWQGFVGVRGTRAMFNDEYAYRIAYRVFVGPIPDGLMICHHCDNGLCVNPAHLYAGTAADNARDAVARGRTVLPNLSGEASPASRHPDAVVRKVREQYASGGMTQAQLARQYRVSQHMVGAWCRGESRIDAGGPITAPGKGHRAMAHAP